MNEAQHSFGVESYKQIRSEVAVLLARIENLFRSSLIASSAVFAWVLTQAFSVSTEATLCIKLPKQALLIAWWIPPAVVALSGLITFATHIRVQQMSGFLSQCEATLGVAELSWEAYLRPKPPLFAGITLCAWLVMLISSVYAMCIGLSVSEAPYCAARQ